MYEIAFFLIILLTASRKALTCPLPARDINYFLQSYSLEKRRIIIRKMKSKDDKTSMW
jgi:hypothetical protein